MFLELCKLFERLRLALDLDLLDEDPSQEQDAAWAEKVEELAMRGITIRQLLDARLQCVGGALRLQAERFF